MREVARVAAASMRRNSSRWSEIANALHPLPHFQLQYSPIAYCQITIAVQFTVFTNAGVARVTPSAMRRNSRWEHGSEIANGLHLLPNSIANLPWQLYGNPKCNQNGISTAGVARVALGSMRRNSSWWDCQYSSSPASLPIAIAHYVQWNSNWV